jgi:hypothetical protein
MKHYDRAFLTGCDHTQEWLLPWFLQNLRKHNNTPIVFADFGIKNKDIPVDHIIDISNTKDKGWFKKPSAMLECPAEKTIWLDTDCEVLDNIEPLFDMLIPNKLCMVDDVPWTKRKRVKWYNSGVVGFINKPQILKDWAKTVSKRPRRGDQETLHSMNRGNDIHELPQEYNWLRVTLENDKQDSPDKKIMHWTGPRGKQRIKAKL